MHRYEINAKIHTNSLKKATSGTISGQKNGPEIDPEMNLHKILCIDIYVFNFGALPVCSGSSGCHQKFRRKILGGGDGGHF